MDEAGDLKGCFVANAAVAAPTAEWFPDSSSVLTDHHKPAFGVLAAGRSDGLLSYC
jgi:hypothetical protein